MNHFLKKSILHVIVSMSIVMALVVPMLTSAQGGTFTAGDPGSSTTYYSDYGAPSTTTSTTTYSDGSSISISCDSSFDTITDFINYLTCLLSRSLVPLVFAIAILVFTWGVVQFVLSPQASEKREEGRMYMIYGIIALFVMVSVWGLVAVLGNTFKVGTEFPPHF